jgi:hypothetical protein
VTGRHRRTRAGLPPLLAVLTIVAALGIALALVQPAPIPDDVPLLPEPLPAAQTTTPQPAPTTTPAAPAPTTTAAAPVMKLAPPTPTTTRPVPKPVPTTTKAAPKPKAVAAPAASAKCTGLGVAANVRHACDVIVAAVPGIPLVGGLGARPANPTSCHPHGLALDLMVYKDKALGDRIYAFVKAHKAELGVTTLLWQVPDHFDHVHASFLPCLR